MLSTHNFELVRSSLENQIKQRNLNYSLSIKSWDTFPGWKKRGKIISKGSKGFKVDLVVPCENGKKNDQKIIQFLTITKVLFSSEQTD